MERKVEPMVKDKQKRGKRRSSAPTKMPFRPHWLAIPLFFLILVLAMGPIGSIWNNGTPVPAGASGSPIPTLVVSEPSVNPTIPAIVSLTFASFNIAGPGNNSVPNWSKRREAFARTVNESNSDVIGLQEATAQDVTGNDNKRMTHWNDVRQLVAPGGYKAVKTEVSTCSGGKSCIHSSHIVYKKATVQQVKLAENLPSSGQGVLGDIVGGLRNAKNREFSWAYLEGKNGTGPFLAISVHTNNETSKSGIRERTRIGQAITKWAEDLNAKSGMTDAPFVLMGDFNSFEKREPKGMVYQLMKDGWSDSFEAVTDEYRFFDQAYTVSYTRGNNSGWPKKPIQSSNPVRIDYIMYKGEGLKADAYQVALRLNEDGTFNNKYRSSDHMMIQAIIRFVQKTGDTASPAATP